MNKYAVVFGGATNDVTTKEYKDTVILGNILADNGYCVKNGGYYGIMEAVSKGVFEKNGYSIGYTCKTFKTIKGNSYLKETIVSENIYERLKFLIDDSDLFVVQKGGVGTLSELFLTLDVIRKKKEKPKVVLIGNFWNKIFYEMSDLISKEEMNLFSIISDVKEIKNFLN